MSIKKISSKYVVIDKTNLSEFLSNCESVQDVVEKIDDLKSLSFITEKDLDVNGVNVQTTHPIEIITNLFIYEYGDVILGTIVHNSNNITLQEDVSPAKCEVTYGYYA